jgi:hypothetical protein
MSTCVQVPTSQTDIWVNRYFGNELADQIRREIDAEILRTLTGGPPMHVPETPDWKLWLTEEMITWCEQMGIPLTVELKYDPQCIWLCFESESHATQFGITWL